MSVYIHIHMWQACDAVQFKRLYVQVLSWKQARHWNSETEKGKREEEFSILKERSRETF